MLDRIGSYGWAYGKTLPKDHDRIEKNYNDLKKGTTIQWDGKAKKVEFVEIEQKENYFVSQ